MTEGVGWWGIIAFRQADEASHTVAPDNVWPQVGRDKIALEPGQQEPTPVHFGRDGDVAEEKQ